MLNQISCLVHDLKFRKLSLLNYHLMLYQHIYPLQVSRSIGDAYLKKAEFNREPLLSKFRFAEPFYKPILKAEPSLSVQKLYPEDQFLIFASDGLWEHLTNQEAVDIVHDNPRSVSFVIYNFLFHL